MTTCHDAPAPAPATTGGAVLLVGNPNVGKSTLFNTLTGARQRVMNAPGTTVELQLGTWRRAGRSVVDLPGTYSLVARTPDEQAAADAVTDADGIAVVLLDAAALPRSLYLLAQVGSSVPVVAAVTMLDVAADRGAAVDVADLEAALGVPVVALDPRAGAGPDDLERALPGARLLHDVPPWRDLEPLAAAEALVGWVGRVTAGLGTPPPPRRTRTDAVDRVLLTPWAGVPVFAAVMWLLFQLATTAAAPLTDLVDGWTGAAADVVRSWLPDGFWQGLLVDGVLVGVGVVLTFLPLLAIIYVALALLEDSGYLARAAFLADRLMRTLGLDGRAMLPLVIGFGCNVPAIAATQTLPNARQRLLTGLLVPWTSCAARLPVYVLLASALFPDHAGTAVFGMYVLSLVLVVGGGLALRGTVFRDVRREPLLLVLPAYQRPRLRTVGLSVWTRVRAFATRAGRIIVVTLTVMWLLMAVPAGQGPATEVAVEDSLYGAAAQAVAPVFTPAGFGDWHLSAALATGFVAKEVVVGSLAQTYAVAEGEDLERGLRGTLEATSGGHGAAAALAFMVFVLGYTPCLATVAEQARRFGARWTAGAVVLQLVVAWVLAVAVFQGGVLLGSLL